MPASTNATQSVRTIDMGEPGEFSGHSRARRGAVVLVAEISTFSSMAT